jgi:NADH-quinone oxidoreductase subunit L
MHGDRGYWRFFAYLNLFTGMMLVLVLGSSFPVMFVGWEGVGLCSYLLIGFWYQEEFRAQAGRKAFIVNRIGDAGFLLAVAAVFCCFGTLEIGTVMDTVTAGAGPGIAWLTAIAVLLFVGACGKSAQVPLYVWLPDAMAGPTPVSALIHAATMVTAGVYMVCRCAALYSAAPVAAAVVTAVGLVTLLLAGTIALQQNELKKVLAYSTVSQLGYMFVAAGVGAYTAAMFHLMTHAFFKAVLFLGAGSVMHALGDEEDMRKMGGLRKALPWTGTAMLLGSLSMIGVPGFAGFFSKDGILLGAYTAEQRWVWFFATLGAILTGFYIFRLIFMTFYGDSRVDPELHPHESPWSMRIALVVLGALSVAGGWIGIPALLGGANRLGHWLQPVFPAGDHEGAHPPASLEFLLMGLATAAGLVGLYLAWRWTVARPEEGDHLAAGFARLQQLVAAKFYVDELYARAVLVPYDRLCRALNRFDAGVIDGAVNACGFTSSLGGHILKLFQTGFVRNYTLSFLIGAGVILWPFLR